MNARSPMIAAMVITCVLALPAEEGRCWIPGGTPVCTAPNWQIQPVIIPDGAGGAFISWFDCRINASNSNIFTQRIDPRGAPLWKMNGAEVCMAPERQYNPIIVKDSEDGAIIAWMDFRLGGADLFAQRVDADGTMLWGRDGSIVNVMRDHQIDPTPVAVGDEWGGAIFAWADETQESDGTRKTDIYAQRLAGNGGYMMWHQFGLPVCTSGGFQIDPVITTDGEGGAIVAWLDKRGGYYADVFAQRLTPAGGKLWQDNGYPVCQTLPDQRGLRIISDGEGGAIFVWYDYTNGSFDIAASRLNGDAHPLWAVNGIAVTSLPEQQRYPSLCSDGAGGCIIAWEDDRHGSIDIYAQRVDAEGNICWPAEGVPINVLGFDQVQPELAPDGAGGAIIVYTDYSEIDFPAICADHVSSNGERLWPQSAVVNISSANKFTPRVAPDGAGGAIVSYGDDRSGSTDIFAQRISPLGALVAAFLQSYSAVSDGRLIRVSWTLAEEDAGAEFRILRADGGSGAYRDVGGIVERAGRSYRFIDRALEPGGSYRYRADITEGGRRRTLFETDSVEIPAAPLTLHQNHPNPFNPATEIRWYLPERGLVSLGIYDAGGTLVRSLHEGPLEKGSHAAIWDGRNDRGERVSSGVYFCRLRAGRETLTRKMILMK